MFYYSSSWAVLWLGCSWASINESRYIMALSRKHFEQFADFMVNLWNDNKTLTTTIIRDIDLKLDTYSEKINIPTSINSKMVDIDEVIEKRLLNHYNSIGKELQLLLDKNGLRFNKYRFKNYILARCEQNDTKIKLITDEVQNGLNT